MSVIRKFLDCKKESERHPFHWRGIKNVTRNYLLVVCLTLLLVTEMSTYRVLINKWSSEACGGVA